MALTLDYTTNNGKVRLLISDIDVSSPIFPYGTEGNTSDPIDGFLSIEGDNVKAAAAAALMSIATNEVLVQKRIKILDLSTDGPAEAAALLQLAKTYKEQAKEDDVEGAFDWAEMTVNNVQYEHIVENGRLK